MYDARNECSGELAMTRLSLLGCSGDKYQSRVLTGGFGVGAPFGLIRMPFFFYFKIGCHLGYRRGIFLAFQNLQNAPNTFQSSLSDRPESNY